MKQSLFLACSLASVFYFSQSGNVGINTTQPAATLDVTGEPASATKLDGIIAPRVTGEQLRAKTYTADQTGAQVYVTTADTAPAGQTIEVTAPGYYYFDGAKWIALNAKNSEPWFDVATKTPATSNTQNIYQSGKVSIGKNVSNGVLSVYDTVGASNSALLYLNYKNSTTNTNPWLGIYGNLLNGSFSTLTNVNDMAWIFSVDNNGSAYTNNGLLLAPHGGGGGATPYGLKITEQGMVSVNSKNPSESFDVTGTVRLRNLPINGASNAIYTNSGGTTTVPASVTTVPIAPTQTFTATRSVVADNNGVLGYVDGLPLTANSNNSRYISSTNTVAIQPTDGTLFINRPNGNTVNIALPTAIDNKNRIISVCTVNYNSNAAVVISNISTLQVSGGSTVLNSTSGNRCLRFQSGASAEDNSAYAWYIISRY